MVVMRLTTEITCFSIDCFDDANFWIATRNYNGPLVPQKGTPSTSTLNKNYNGNSNFQPQIASKSLETISNNQESHADDSSNYGPSTSKDEPESIATEFYKKMKRKPSLKTKHPAVDKKMRFENIPRKVAIPLKYAPSLMKQNQPWLNGEIRNYPTSFGSRFIYPGNIPPTTRINIERIHYATENSRAVSENNARIVSVPLNLPSSPQQHPNQHMQQTARRPNLLQRLTEAQRRDLRLRSEHRPSSAAIAEEDQCTGRPVPVFDLSGRINQLLPTFNSRERMHRLSIRRVARLPISPYRIPVSPTSPRSIRSTSFPQETVMMLRKPSSLLFPNLPNSIQHALLNTHSILLSEEEESQSYLAQGTPFVVTRSDSIINSGIPVQANLYLRPRMQTQMVDHSNGNNQVYYQDDIDRSYSPSDIGVGMDHDGNSAYQIPAEEAFVERANNFNHSQNNLRFVSEQQIKDQFVSTSTQMASTLNRMVNAFENFRNSILGTAASYQILLENMERFASENQVNQASRLRHMTQETPLVAEERENAANGNANFNGEQDRNDVNDAPDRNLDTTSRLILPPEYDPNDTRWTLKYHEDRPGLVELVPHTSVYVDYGELKYLEQTSSNSISLAQRVLLEVFSKEAMSVCSSMTETGHDYSIYPEERPKLNEHGCFVLLRYILEHGLQRDWKTDMQFILRA